MSFKIQKIESMNKTVRMPTDLIHSLEHLANCHDVSFNQLVVQCCRYALEHLDTSDTKTTENSLNY